MDVWCPRRVIFLERFEARTKPRRSSRFLSDQSHTP
jgi:hypothetical protein